MRFNHDRSKFGDDVISDMQTACQGVVDGMMVSSNSASAQVLTDLACGFGAVCRDILERRGVDGCMAYYDGNHKILPDTRYHDKKRQRLAAARALTPDDIRRVLTQECIQRDAPNFNHSFPFSLRLDSSILNEDPEDSVVTGHTEPCDNGLFQARLFVDVDRLGEVTSFNTWTVVVSPPTEIRRIEFPVRLLQGDQVRFRTIKRVPEGRSKRSSDGLNIRRGTDPIRYLNEREGDYRED